jgi:hypothetical protein
MAQLQSGHGPKVLTSIVLQPQLRHMQRQRTLVLTAMLLLQAELDMAQKCIPSLCCILLTRGSSAIRQPQTQVFCAI